jgi:hypothetical protein
LGRFDIALGRIPKEELPKKKQYSIPANNPGKPGCKPSSRYEIASKGKSNIKVSEDRRIIIDIEDESERPIKQRTDAHRRTHVGEANVDSMGKSTRQDNANESFDSLLDQLIGKVL